MTKKYDLSTWEGRQAVLTAVADSSLPDILKVTLAMVIDKYPRPLGRPPDPKWKKQQKQLRALVVDLNGPRGTQAAAIRKLVQENRRIGAKAAFDRINRPNRNRKKI